MIRAANDSTDPVRVGHVGMLIACTGQPSHHPGGYQGAWTPLHAELCDPPIAQRRQGA